MARWSRKPEIVTGRNDNDPAEADRVALWRWKARTDARIGLLLPDEVWGDAYDALSDAELRELAESLLDDPERGEAARGVIGALDMAEPDPGR